MLFASCAGRPDAWTFTNPDPRQMPPRAEIYAIDDYKGKDQGEEIPEWVNLYLEYGPGGVESMEIYQFHYIFVSRNEGNSINALNHWAEGFSPDLDFPRLAAARIERRFFAESPIPDREFGSFFIDLIRAASDAVWMGSTWEDDFWMHKRSGPDETGSWEILILTAMPKTRFISQFDIIFNSVNFRIPPSWEQLRAIGRIRDRFFDGF